MSSNITDPYGFGNRQRGFQFYDDFSTTKSNKIYYQELGDLLYYMMSCYNDTDVQDKARFFYALITGATDNKVQTVLKTSVSDVESLNQAITSLLPGKTDKVSLARIIQLEEPVFHWERLSVSTLAQRSNTDDITYEGSHLLQYEEELKHIQVVLDLKCRLKMKEGSSFERVHAVSIHVQESPAFQPIPDRHIACLAHSGHQDVTLKVVPRLPLPLSLNCSVEFTSEDKLTYRTVLCPLDVEFSHLLMELPLKTNYYKELQFSTLWDWVLNRKNGDRSSIESVKLFAISVEKYKLVHKAHLSEFVFRGEADTASDWCYAMFLPPSHHILLKCRSQSSTNQVVSIATDTWTLLPHVDRFLDGIMN